MDFQRLILTAVFAGSLFMLYQKWEQQNAPKPASAIPALPDAADKSGAGAVPGAPASAAGAASGPAAALHQATPMAPVKTERVTVRTDDVIAEIDGLGGTLTRLELVKHHYTGDPRDLINKISALLGLDSGKAPETHTADEGFVLLEQTPERLYIAQSGFIGDNLPNHKTAFIIQPGPRELKDGEDQLEVRLDAVGPGPVKVTKVYVFHRGSYVIDVRFEITNQGASQIAPTAYFQIAHDGKPGEVQQRFVSSFTGPAFYTDADKYHKIQFTDIDKGKAAIPPRSDNGWVAMLQHYFVSAWLLPKTADPSQQYEFYAEKVEQNLYRAGAKLPLAAIAPGAKASLDVPFYSGPEEQDKLATVAPGLDLVVDYGWLTIIAKPLFKVLEWLHKWVHNWGIAIILLTCLVKALFFPLAAASYKSMARMRVVGPRMQKLKEQFGDDRLKLNQAMMDLYKTEKINPLGGCLPIVVQIPVFISLYWVLLASVEMRNAPFLWLHDLSSRDPFCILPIIMTATSYIQIKLNPTPPDPVQAKVMMIMPLAFAVMFFFFPAGLVLYWVVNNVLSIAQQWQITRTIEGAKERQRR
jgi:YidC/Oxa1 family membrane protein insertase